MPTVRQLFDPESGTYTYFITESVHGWAIIIDPVSAYVDLYMSLCKELNLELHGVLDTHIHADHITGSGLLHDKTDCDVVMGEHTQAEGVTRILKHGEVYYCGRLGLTCLHTPGHTEESCVYMLAHEGQICLFTGDTLLIRGTGRTDFQGGDAATQYHSLFDVILQLPDETLVYPGHDYHGRSVSTLGEEKRHNPRLQVTSEAEYVNLMNSLDLPPPAMIDKAVPLNMLGGREAHISEVDESPLLATSRD
ncbi:MBL fold metallo-hydrolase [Endozoicomonadaceae bacterium StTr2]